MSLKFRHDAAHVYVHAHYFRSYHGVYAAVRVGRTTSELKLSGRVRPFAARDSRVVVFAYNPLCRMRRTPFQYLLISAPPDKEILDDDSFWDSLLLLFCLLLFVLHRKHDSRN